ncbi:MAG: TetR/AcrR family transcriptional regulator [Parvibaculales bacterium]
MSNLVNSGREKTGRRSAKRADNRSAILSAARSMFSELGYGATTVRDIIRQTGLASGTFYNYFDGKDEIFRALIEDMGIRLRASLKESRQNPNSVEEGVMMSFFAYFSFFANNPEDYKLVRSNRGREGGRMSGPQLRAGLEELRQDIQDYIAQHKFPEVDVDYMAAAATGIAFAILDVMMARAQPDPHEAARFAASLTLRGVEGLK